VNPRKKTNYLYAITPTNKFGGDKNVKQRRFQGFNSFYGKEKYQKNLSIILYQTNMYKNNLK
jgi:hypothetical protein